jgi:membrane protein
MKMEKLTNIFKKVMNVILKPEMRVLPGQLAFFFVLSIIPLIALIGAITSKFQLPLDMVQEYVNGAIPASVSELLLSIVSPKVMNFNMAVFFVSAFILASNGTHSMIITSNEIYKIKSDNFLKRRLKAIFMTIILVSVLLFIILIPVFGDTIFTLVKETSNNQSLANFLYGLYQILKYPLSIIIIYINIKLLYVLAPDKKIRSKSATKGAIFTTISWVVSTEIFTFYVGTFAKYDVFYGNISNIIILLLWIYLLSYIFVLGMAFNAGFTKEEDIERTGMLLTRK